MDNSKLESKLKNKLNKRKLHKDILKVLIATAVFYVGLFSFSKKVGEEIDYFQEQSTTPQAANTGINTQVIDTLQVQTGFLTPNNQHKSAKLALLHALKEKKHLYQEKFESLCKQRSTYCSVLDFNGLKNYQKKIIYLKLTEAIGDFITEHQQYGKPILSVLKKIDVLNKKGSPRAYASWSKITIHRLSVGDYKEFFNLIGHEIGHVMDLGAIQGYAKVKHPLFTEFGKKKFGLDDPSLTYYKLSWIDEQTRKEDMDEVHFCSRYGMNNPFEDFAECHNLYLNHNNMFLFMARHNKTIKAKYNFMANLYGGKYLFDNKHTISKLGLNPQRRTWDTTKLHKK